MTNEELVALFQDAVEQDGLDRALRSEAAAAYAQLDREFARRWLAYDTARRSILAHTRSALPVLADALSIED